jgi:hypothetical protein
MPQAHKGYNQSIAAIPMPARIQALPISSKGFPVPWFVASVNGDWDFRVIRGNGVATAYKKKLCWVCGQPLGRNVAMTLGPMCAINRTISEPGAHKECAIYSLLACPFLSNPRMRRNEKGLPEHMPMAGVGILRNPGAMCVWITRKFWPRKGLPAGTGVLFTFDDPIETLWFAEGREATREEVLASIDSGYPLLHDMAIKDGPEGVKFLARQRDRAMQYLPAA